MESNNQSSHGKPRVDLATPATFSTPAIRSAAAIHSAPAIRSVSAGRSIAAIQCIVATRSGTITLAFATTLAATLGTAPFAHADPSHGAPHDTPPQWQELQSRVQSLEAREEIRILMHDYGRLLDERNFDDFAQLFSAQSEYDSGGLISKGPAAIAAFLKDIIGRNPAGYKTPNFHIFFNESIEVQGDRGTAVSKSAFVVPGEGNKADAVILANYHDVFIRENGRWKFLKRVVRSDIPAPKPK